MISHPAAAPTARAPPTATRPTPLPAAPAAPAPAATPPPAEATTAPPGAKPRLRMGAALNVGAPEFRDRAGWVRRSIPTPQEPDACRARGAPGASPAGNAAAALDLRR